MRKLTSVSLQPTRYQDPVQCIKDYRVWFLANKNRKRDFVSDVEFLRTALIGRFYMFWMLADYFEDLAIIQGGKQLVTRVTVDD